MIFGIGSDLIEISRIESAVRRLGKPFLNRIFTEEEIAYCYKNKNPYPSLTARFAAKEACSKALGCGISAQFSWKDCWVKVDERGKPLLVLSQKAQKNFGHLLCHLSLSHTHTTALAFVILEKA